MAKDKNAVEVTKKQQKVAEKEVETANVQAEAVTTEAVKAKPELDEDVKATKNIAWLAYLLFFIPLLINKTSPYVRHNANEGLEINVFDFIGTVLLCVGVLVDSANSSVQLLMIIFTIVGLGLLVLTIVTKIYMIIAVLHGKKVDTPWMWNLKIIK